MTTPEMHVWFRQYAQQMGMQNVRAILPEQIDILINTSITDTVNRIVAENIALTNDRIITDNSKLGQINALRTLYKSIAIDFTNPEITKFPKPNSIIGKLVVNIDSLFTTDESKYLFIDDFSINYKTAAKDKGFTLNDNAKRVGIYEEDGFETLLYPVRLIENRYLADSLNDFVLKPRFRSPIGVVYKENTGSVLELYIDKFFKNESNAYTLKHNFLPYQLIINYVAKPAKVEYNEDMEINSINCDLPEYMHVDIVKHAVDLYRMAIAGALQGTQGQQQVAQQENMRNNYRNDGTRQ